MRQSGESDFLKKRALSRQRGNRNFLTTSKEVPVKKTGIVILIALCFMTLSVVSAMAYGGGEGGADAQDTSERNNPPAEFTPIDMSKQLKTDEKTLINFGDDQSKRDQKQSMSSVGATRTTGGPRQWEDMSPAERKMLLEKDKDQPWLFLSGGAGAGLGPEAAAVAGGLLSGAKTALENRGKPPGKRTSVPYVVARDTAIGLLPIPEGGGGLAPLAADALVQSGQQKAVQSHPPAINRSRGFAHTYVR